VSTTSRYSCVHGTRYLYLAVGCRCHVCTAANTSYVTAWRPKRSQQLQPDLPRDFTLRRRLPLRSLPGSQRRKRPAPSSPQDGSGSILIRRRLSGQLKADGAKGPLYMGPVHRSQVREEGPCKKPLLRST
jgi:hypothetical protein